MPTPRDVLTPSALAMLQVIADTGSFAAAARAVNMVPSALTYRVRQMEDALDGLLFDRSSRQAHLTEAGAELLREGAHLLADIDAIANRVKRVATGWEPMLTIAVDSVIARDPLLDGEGCRRFTSIRNVAARGQQSHHRRQQCRLARAIGADHADDRSGRDPQ